MKLLPSPEESHLPISSFSEEELLACQDAEAIQEAQSIRGMLSNACEVTHRLTSWQGLKSICPLVFESVWLGEREENSVWGWAGREQFYQAGIFLP